MKKYILNYISRNGIRTSMLFTPHQKEALELLCKYHNFKHLKDYIYYVIDSGLSDGVGVSLAVKEQMFNELLYFRCKNG